MLAGSGEACCQLANAEQQANSRTLKRCSRLCYHTAITCISNRRILPLDDDHSRRFGNHIQGKPRPTPKTWRSWRQSGSFWLEEELGSDFRQGTSRSERIHMALRHGFENPRGGRGPKEAQAGLSSSRWPEHVVRLLSRPK